MVEHNALPLSQLLGLERHGSTTRNVVQGCRVNSDIADYITAAQDLSSWTVLRNEESVSNSIVQLKRAIDLIHNYQDKMLDVNIFQKIFYLGALEQSLSARPGFAAEFMKLLAGEIEDHIGRNDHSPGMHPVRPCAAPDDMKQLSDDLDALSEKTFGSTPTKLYEWGAWQMGLHDLFHAPLDHNKLEMMQKEEDALIPRIKELLTEIQTKNNSADCRWTDDQSMLGYIVVEAFKRAASRGRYGWLGAPFMMSRLTDPKRSSLPWAQLGVSFVSLLKKGYLTTDDVVFGVAVEDTFIDLVTVTIPAFTEQASELLAILEYKKTMVATFRAKILAVILSVGIAGSNLVVRLLGQVIGEASESE